jgi:uncharacterized lipoprotein YmbA
MRAGNVTRVLALALLLAAVTGCGGVSLPTSFHTLAALQPEGTAPVTEQRPRALVVGVGPISLPDYLDRPQIVTRSGPTGVQLADFDSWAESLTTLVPRTMAENLAVLLETDRVVPVPERRNQRLDYQIEADFMRFDVVRGGDMELDALWRLYGRDGDRLLKDGRSRIAIPVAEDADASTVVAAMSQGLEQFTRALADVVKAIPSR